MESNYISIKQILDNVLVHPMLQDVTLERAVSYAVDFMRIVGMPTIFMEKVITLELVDNRVLLPDDFFEVIQIKMTSNKRTEVFRSSGDSFHMDTPTDETLQSHALQELTYKIQGGVLITSVSTGTISLAYRAIPLDTDGFPLVIDNSPFTRALELYIKKQAFTILFDMNKIPMNVYQNTVREYAFAVAQASSSLTRLNIDQMQSFTNMWNTLIPRVTEHHNSFKTLGSQEKLKMQ